MLKLKNKRNFFSILLFSITCLFNSNVFADQHTISINHIYTRFPDSKTFKIYDETFHGNKNNPKGINLQYRYESKHPISFLSSITYSSHYKILNAKNYTKGTNFYKSFLIGPAYRWNEFFSFYAITGFSNIKHDVEMINIKGNNIHEGKPLINKTNHKNSFTYGIGLIINPLKTLSINLGYEKTYINSAIYDGKINGFIFGVGYSF